MHFKTCDAEKYLDTAKKIFNIQALKLDIEIKDDKIGGDNLAPVAATARTTSDDGDNVSVTSEIDLRSFRKQKLDLDYRVRDQVSGNY